MVFFDLVGPPNITINVAYLPMSRVMVSISSDADISGVNWTIDTMMTSYSPNQKVVVNPNFVQLYYFSYLFKNLHLTDYYDGNHMGSNLLTYLETKDTPLVFTTSESSDMFPFAIGLIGVTVASIIIGFINNK
jgi:hypothetical protein